MSDHDNEYSDSIYPLNTGIPLKCFRLVEDYCSTCLHADAVYELHAQTVPVAYIVVQGII